MKRIDLHVHSSESDGTMSPLELVSHAADCGLTAFALTDHDTTSGLEEAIPFGKTLGVEVLAGIEFSTDYKKQDIHIVGIEIDWKNPEFHEKIQYYRNERFRRNQRIIDRMAADGIDISYEKMCSEFPGATWTRAHFARYLADHGYVSEMWNAFELYLKPGCPYHVPREKITPADAVKLIRQFGGIPVLAHPMQYNFPEEMLRTLLDELCSVGLIGMEVYYSTHTPEQTQYLQKLASEYQLMPGGGSDFHGTNKPSIFLGSGKHNLNIPYEILEGLRKRRTECSDALN